MGCNREGRRSSTQGRVSNFVCMFNGPGRRGGEGRGGTVKRAWKERIGNVALLAASSTVAIGGDCRTTWKYIKQTEGTMPQSKDVLGC